MAIARTSEFLVELIVVHNNLLQTFDKVYRVLKQSANLTGFLRHYMFAQ